jgi:hypothetical protein
VEDGSFLKFNSATLKYSFDKSVINRLGMSALSLNLTVYNLYMWTRYTGMNPEVSIRNTAKSEGDIYSIGYDTSKAPVNMNIMLGVNVTF